ncbi:MAG: M15 family metallopeptidase [Crocinitomicaceae bacterium]|nr:M15 family metallopeptidase [Crocinitomicaceae bacterium]
MKRLLLFGILFAACSSDPVVTDSGEFEFVEIILEDRSQEVLDSITRVNLEEIGLVDIQSVDSNILVDLRYASDNNFMDAVLYDTLNQLFLQKDVAERLSKCQSFLDSIHPGYHLLVYDGVRPVQVQQEMWDALDSIPVLNRGKFVSNPALGSVHNFGAAVDLTILDSLLKPLDMGAGYDDFRRIAFPSLEAHFLESGELTQEQWQNRKLLRQVMRFQSFSNIPSEWWHFNAYSRITASHKYQLLRSESGDAVWFKIAPKIVDQSDSLINPE